MRKKFSINFIVFARYGSERKLVQVEEYNVFENVFYLVAILWKDVMMCVYIYSMGGEGSLEICK